MSSDKGKQARIPWLKFSAEVKVRRSFFNSEWIGVFPSDFTRLGMGMQTDEVFEKDEQVLLNLSLDMEAGSTKLAAVPAIVKSKIKHHSRFNYELEFDYSARSFIRNKLEDELIRIEDILDKHAKLQDRMSKASPTDTL